MVDFSTKLNVSVLVEGRNDVKALEQAGFTNVHSLSGPIFEVVEQFEKGETLELCFDNDVKGRDLMKRFTHEFAQRGVKTKTSLRDEILALGVTRIEDLFSYMKRRT